jgi:hypothetical protein
VDALQVKGLGAILSLVGLVSARSRRHSSGRHSVVCFQRNPRKIRAALIVLSLLGSRTFHPDLITIVAQSESQCLQ